MGGRASETSFSEAGGGSGCLALDIRADARRLGSRQWCKPGGRGTARWEGRLCHGVPPGRPVETPPRWCGAVPLVWREAGRRRATGQGNLRRPPSWSQAACASPPAINFFSPFLRRWAWRWPKNAPWVTRSTTRRSGLRSTMPSSATMRTSIGPCPNSVVEGRVLLKGSVPTREDRARAVRLAGRAAGVREVIDELQEAGGGEGPQPGCGTRGFRHNSSARPFLDIAVLHVNLTQV